MSGFTLDFIHDLSDPFFNPKKRVFIGYLISAFLLALGIQIFSARTSFVQTLASLFSKRLWLSLSAKADYKIMVINQTLMLGVGPRLISKLAVATLIFESLHIWFDGRSILALEVSGLTITIYFTVSLFLIDDVTKYAVHRALHRFEFLWAFHRIHHTAEVLTPLTVYRTHPVEMIIFSLRSIIAQGVTIALFLYFFGARAEIMTVLGANVFLFIFNLAGSNLRHSHVWVSYGQIIERFLISPAQHQIHHSINPLHFDRNFGAVLAIWDWLGGSLELAQCKKSLQFGNYSYNKTAHSLKTLYISPFIEAFHPLTNLRIKDTIKMPQIFSRKIRGRTLIGIFLFLCALTVFNRPSISAELNIYSHRQPFLINPFIDAYKKQTGTKVNIVFASKGLAQRLQAEGPRSPADVILTVDIARLHVYADKNLLSETNSPVLNANIPPHLRDRLNRWFAFSKRARIIVAAKRAKDTFEITRYEDLSKSKWRGRICSRPGSHVYNRALIASVINASGPEAAQKWAQGVVNNLARRPQGNDRAQVKAIYEGQCDIAIINNYYFGKLKHAKNADQQEWANSVRLIFPNQKDRGTHVNISGGGIAKYSKNKIEARRFLEFLTSKTAQDLYGSVNFEYPVSSNVAISEELSSWGGAFIEDRMPIARIAALAPEAQKIIDRVGW
ncbi:MAG: hypothetical protein CMF69_08330 [Magnetovibrio sp.]|nr:hypothetical protein [Magnetovibrio sp.]